MYIYIFKKVGNYRSYAKKGGINIPDLSVEELNKLSSEERKKHIAEYFDEVESYQYKFGITKHIGNRLNIYDKLQDKNMEVIKTWETDYAKEVEERVKATASHPNQFWTSGQAGSEWFAEKYLDAIINEIESEIEHLEEHYKRTLKTM